MAASEMDYAYLRQLVVSQSSNHIDASRNALFETRLTSIARVAGASNLHELVEILKADQPPHLQRAVAEAMTINETSFFRDKKPFDALRVSILPRLIEARRSTRKLHIWSAATSTGQEAYSLAILIREYFRELDDWDVNILGTDISHEVLASAERGRYRRIDINRGLPAKLLLKHFIRSGDEWEVHPHIKSLCTFTYANLCILPQAFPVCDLVLLRNVLLYFPEAERKSALSNVHQVLAPDGYLFLGSAEQAEDSTDRFRVEFAAGSYFYRAAPQG